VAVKRTGREIVKFLKSFILDINAGDVIVHLGSAFMGSEPSYGDVHLYLRDGRIVTFYNGWSPRVLEDTGYARRIDRKCRPS
jgi:hypothetical protein